LDKHQIETAYRIQKIDVKFSNHLKGSDSQTFHNKAITYREKERSPQSKLVLGLCSQTQTHPTEPEDSNTIKPYQIMRKQKDNFLAQWNVFKQKNRAHQNAICP
jgi:hypothetical protein